MIKDIRIRAFRATDDPETCKEFVKGHKKILEDYGITQLSSSSDNWVNTNSTFVIVVEALNGKLLGGARIQAANGIIPLPIEMATGSMDARIFGKVKEKAINGTGELCGVWNSKEASGLGVGSYFSIQAAMAICHQIGLDSLFILCAPHTLKMFQQYGGSVIIDIGNKGTFYYPKIDLLTTAMFYNDLKTFDDGQVDKKEKLKSLIHTPVQDKVEISPKTEISITIQYNLLLTNIEKEEFKKPYNTDFSKSIKPSLLKEFGYPIA